MSEMTIICKLIRKLNKVVDDHEQRLQRLEKSLGLIKELKHLRNQIEDIDDEQKRKAALFRLASLCEALCINDLEAHVNE